MIKNYFVCANSARGFQNFFASNLQGLCKVFILKGGPGTGKSTLMKKVGTIYDNMNYDVEYIHCSSDPDSLDGVVIRKLGVAIVDGTAPHVIEPTAPGALEEYVHLGDAWDLSQLEGNVETILKIQGEIKQHYANAYQYFEQGIAVHDEWEKIYISEMNFTRANEIAELLKQWIVGSAKKDKTAVVYHRFFGATTPNGPIDYIDNLTQDMKTRYFIKGRPGSGKSSILKKVSQFALDQGFDTEIYHCAFDPNSLDMVIIPELQVCVFDSTSPHEHFPSREGDVIVDVYSECITPGTDEKYQTELTEISGRYRECINQAKAELAGAKCLHDELERFYINATDFGKINQIRKDLLVRIQKIQVMKL